MLMVMRTVECAESVQQSSQYKALAVVEHSAGTADNAVGVVWRGVYVACAWQTVWCSC